MRRATVPREQTGRGTPATEVVSPELALVDPELARRARMLLPDPGHFARARTSAPRYDELWRQSRAANVVAPPPPISGVAKDAPTRRRRRSVPLLVAAGCLLGVAGAIVGVKVGRISDTPTLAAAPKSGVAAKRAVAPRSRSRQPEKAIHAPKRRTKATPRAAGPDLARAYMVDRLAGPKFPTVRWAVSVFGKPYSRQRTHDYCRVGWRAAGLTIVLNRVGRSNPCRTGQPVGALIKGKRWRTTRGLRVGQPLRELRLKYRRAQARPDGWWLLVVSRRSLLGRARSQPTLMAHVSRRRVDAFVVN